jgi:hypothetical protein
MKNIVVTVIVGFITGLIISGVLVDVIKFVGKSFSGIKTSWSVVKADKVYSGEGFSDSNLVVQKSSNQL